MVEHFLLGRLRDARETREFGMMESTEPLGDISRPRRCRVGQLAVKLHVAPNRRSFAKPIDDGL
jgi:hypothetical protein